MTRKHYQLIADVISMARAVDHAKGEDALTFVENLLADELRLDNPRFNPSRFKDACRFQYKGDFESLRREGVNVTGERVY